MSGFSAEWLALREPHDAAARAVALVERLRRTSAARPNGGAAAPRTIVDLGAGSGANLRWLDHDESLLAAAARALGDWAASRGAELRIDGEPRDAGRAQLVVRGADFSCRVRRARVDLASELARIELPLRALVTSSALLDLVSARWLEALAHRCRAAAADVYFALTYDGRTVCTPAEPEDSEVLDLLNRHQTGDKGFGPALGPTAAQHAAEVFASLGYGVTVHASDWSIPARDAPLQRALLAGWPERAAALRAWHARRLAHVDALRSQIAVGHVDFVGIHAR